MYRGTTPRFTLTLNTSVDLANVVEMWVTFKNSLREINKTFSSGDVTIDSEEKKVYVRLTQEETLKLYDGAGNVQVRFRTQSGNAYATEIKEIDVNKILKDGVI